MTGHTVPCTLPYKWGVDALIGVKGPPGGVAELSFADTQVTRSDVERCSQHLPLQYSCLKNTMDRGAQQATVHGVPELDMTE